MSMKEISFRDVRITIGDRSFLLKQVPFRGDEAKVLPNNKLAEIVAKRLAGSDSISSFRHGDDAKKAWEYLSQRTNRELEIVEIPFMEFLSAETAGKIILETEFQGQNIKFIVGMLKTDQIIGLMNTVGIDSSRYSIHDMGVINGLSLNDLNRVLAGINACSMQSFSLPSHDFIKHVRMPIDGYLKMMGIECVWLKEEHIVPGNGVVYDFVEHAPFAVPVTKPDPRIGIILQVTG